MVQSEQNIVFPQGEVDNWISLWINRQLFHAMHLSQCIELLQGHKVCLLELQVLKKSNPNKLNEEAKSEQSDSYFVPLSFQTVTIMCLMKQLSPFHLRSL